MLCSSMFSLCSFILLSSNSITFDLMVSSVETIFDSCACMAAHRSLSLSRASCTDHREMDNRIRESRSSHLLCHQLLLQVLSFLAGLLSLHLPLTNSVSQCSHLFLGLTQFLALDSTRTGVWNRDTPHTERTIFSTAPVSSPHFSPSSFTAVQATTSCHL